MVVRLSINIKCMDINKLGKGAHLDSTDHRDYDANILMGDGDFDWEKGYDIEKELGMKLKVEHQNGSSSCVGQAWSKYIEVLEIIENGFTDLSAKDIYSRIFFPETGGATLRSGAKIVVDRGVTKETTNPSYMNGKPPTEEFMREIIEGNEKEAKFFAAKSYARTTHNSFTFMARMIRDNKGFISGVLGDNAGWRPGKDGIVKPPVSGGDWGHAIFFGKAKMVNGEKMLGFINSWGEEWGDIGWGWIKENYLEYLFNIWTLIDEDNSIKNNSMVYAIVGSEQYLLDESLLIALNIADEKELETLKTKGLSGDPVVFENVDGYTIYPLLQSNRFKDLLGL